MALTDAELVILGLLVEQPRHGYELEQVIAERGIREWAVVAFSSIYYVLGKLEHRELGVAGEGPGTKARRVFRPTTVGLVAAKEATRARLVEPTPGSTGSFLVALANSPLIDNDELANALKVRLATVESRIQAVANTRQAQRPLPAPAEAVFSYSLSLLEAEGTWLETTSHRYRTMTKADFKKGLASYRASSDEFQIVEVPPLQYLMVDGHGDPNTAQEYTDAVAALYSVAYKLKFASKKELGKDYVVMPLESLWWAEDMDSFTDNLDKSQWDWTAMIMVPDWITPDMFDDAIAKAAAKNPPASLGDVRMETLREGLCVQRLHIGAYDDEAETLAELHHTFIPNAGLKPSGKHHEIYFSDIRKVEPAKLRTILRQPVERA